MTTPLTQNSEMFGRVELMLGTPAVCALARARVAIFGLGGVGSWCAESLVRSGVRRLMLVDSDRVCLSNMNRQLMATTKTVGQIKAVALANRLREINPDVEIDVRPMVYDERTAAEFDLAEWDYVVDAIDSLESKARLVRHALSVPTVTLFSSMGAARKMDPSQIRSSDFRKVFGDGLARALRQKFRKTGGIPARRFTCVWSPERRENRGTSAEEGARVNGTVAHTTAIFGFTLAGLVVADVERCLEKSNRSPNGGLS